MLLAFTVDELGRVVDPRVVDAQPQSGFKKAALNAITRFKFKPQVVDGTAIAVPGVQQRTEREAYRSITPLEAELRLKLRCWCLGGWLLAWLQRGFLFV